MKIRIISLKSCLWFENILIFFYIFCDEKDKSVILYLKSAFKNSSDFDAEKYTYNCLTVCIKVWCYGNK